MMDWMGKLALELIAQAGLGYTFNSLQGENNDYANALKSFVYVAPRIIKSTAKTTDLHISTTGPRCLASRSGVHGSRS